MDLPYELKNAVEKQAEGLSIKRLALVSETITAKYKSESGKGNRLITKSEEALTYSIVRMPATYGAVYSALQSSLKRFSDNIESMLDAGAGTGAAAWAAKELIGDIPSVTLLEREEEMIAFGKKLMLGTSLETVNWLKTDLSADFSDLKADLVTASYALNELSPRNRIETALKLFNASEKLLVIVETGTPQGYKVIREVTDVLVKNGAFILAPCPTNGVCPLNNDWCQFNVRIQRGKLHKAVKQADSPFEDEKYIFTAFTKTEPERTKGRILRHPEIGSAKISLKVCGVDGIQTITVTKSDKDRFKRARKADCGDEWEF